MDNFKIQILEDGTIKLVTDGVGAANHANAEQFFAQVARLAGGETERKSRKGEQHHHHHNHDHQGAEHKHSH
jgi:hypothetical protein